LRPERFCSFSAACFAARFSFSVLCAGFFASFFCLSAPFAMRKILPDGHTGCMKIEIWSDVVCPWCYIGKRRFESALARFEHAGEVEVEWKSFELDPNAPVRRGSTAEHLARKYGMTLEQVARSHERTTALAAAEGLEYHLDETKGGNTFDAHRLLQLAKARGLGGEMKERLMRAYFTECEPIGEREVLVRLGEELGLADATEVLASDVYAGAVRRDEHEARLLGISAVPFFVVDRFYGIEGAQPPDAILQALDEAWAAKAAA
jgi:predicted DsbA family dithiol-disulfide isomerase